MIGKIIRGLLGDKGADGENMVQFGLWFHLDGKVYRRCHDIIIPIPNAHTTQIDHVYVSIYGIFVIESKNYTGWIFGSPDQKQWTQSLPGGRKFQFQNPLHQNAWHIKHLAAYLALPESVFESMVFFIGRAEFKTPMPPNVMLKGSAPYIKGFTSPRLTNEQVESIVERLSNTKTNKALQSNAAHVRSLAERHAAPAVHGTISTPVITTDACPKCGKPLVERTAKADGHKFIGCTGFPKCGYKRT